jgi:hypothetical protein
VPVGTLPTPRRAGSAGLRAGAGVLVALAALLAGAVALAVPAQAADDPARPDAHVTHGPSCRPGGVVVEVTAGTVAYAVTLATTRAPEGEDAAEVQPGQVAVLRTGDVAWGETIDSRLEFTALDGSGTSYVDELEGFEFTRPAEEDCAAIAAPSGSGDAPPTQAAPPPSAAPAEQAPVPAPTPSPDAAPAPAPVPPSGAASAPEVVPLPPSGPSGQADAPGPEAGGGVPAGGAVVASAGPVAAGDAVTLTAGGFEPGEVVTVRVAEGTVLAAVPAGPDGEVEATVRIPGGAAGTTTLELVGAESTATAAVQVRVAAAASPIDPDPVPVALVAAGLALVVSTTGLVLSAGGRRPEWAEPTGSA